MARGSRITGSAAAAACYSSGVQEYSTAPRPEDPQVTKGGSYVTLSNKVATECRQRLSD